MKGITKKQQEAVQSFHLYVSEFIASILEIYPDNELLNSYNNRFHLICNANPFKPIEYFYETIYPYEDKILKKDVDFFVSFDSNSNIEANNVNLMEALQLRKLWDRLNETERNENKETIFMYLHLLLMLTKEYYEI